MKGRSEEERAAAHRAQKSLEDLVLHKMVRLENRAQEKYGRLLADVYVGDIHINQWLLDKGYVNAYDGGTKEGFQGSTSAVKNRLEGVNVE
jgi:endonuclease YncB( thermonuclease family)